MTLVRTSSSVRPSRWKRATMLWLALAVWSPRGAQASELERLFARAATVELSARGPGALVRLTLPSEVLAACRPDLSDLRLLDGRGVETPFVLDRGALPKPEPTRIKSVVVTPLAVERHETPRAGARPLLQESYELAAPPEAPSGGSWELVLEASARHFVRQLDVEGTLPDGKRVVLKANDSVFRLKDGHGERLRVPLPALPGPRLRVTLTGEDTSALEPRFRFEAVESLAPEPEALIELTVARLSTTVGRTWVELARPPGIVPSALRLTSTTAAFNRAVEVKDLGGPSHSRVLGRASLFRVQGQSLLEGLEVPLEPARGALLGVSVEDGDSPALAAMTWSAVVRAPSLVFSLPADSGPTALPTLYFGGGRAHAPRYDLASLVPAAAVDTESERARAAQSLFDSAQLSSARLIELRDNARFDRAPALEFAQRAGAEVDARVYSHRRRVELTPSGDGLAELVLGPRDLTVMRADFADARVVDSAGRQWPFLLENARHDAFVGLPLGERKREGRASRSALVLPFTPLTASALVLDTKEPYFDRSYRLRAVASDGRPSELAAGRLTRTVDGAPVPLILEFPAARLRSLELEVDDGDNAPLAFEPVRARVPVPSLYVVATPGSYQVLLGNPNAEPARYDIESARSLVLSVASVENPLLGLEANPTYRAASRLAAGGGPERIALWVVLGVAVLLLGGMTLRLIRRESDGAGKAAP